MPRTIAIEMNGDIEFEIADRTLKKFRGALYREDTEKFEDCFYRAPKRTTSRPSALREDIVRPVAGTSFAQLIATRGMGGVIEPTAAHEAGPPSSVWRSKGAGSGNWSRPEPLRLNLHTAAATTA
jgi:hypothetical protein